LIQKFQIMINPKSRIILDADVIIHFIKGELLLSLTEILPNSFIILDKVKEEILQPQQKAKLNEFIELPRVAVIEFPDQIEYIKEYAHIMSSVGYNMDSGESACLVYAKFNKDVLASSNLKDIKKYCRFHKIEYLTTIDLLFLGYENGVLTSEECDEFIRKVIRKGSKLPNESFSKIIEKRKS